MEIPAGSGYIRAMAKHPKRPRDPWQLAKLMIDIASGEASDGPTTNKKDPAAVLRGRAGGIKGGKARAEKLTEQDRRHQATMAALARWRKP